MLDGEDIHVSRIDCAAVIVSHSVQQAARISQNTAFFHLGNPVEYGDTGATFTNHRDSRTQSYITGRIGRVPHTPPRHGRVRCACREPLLESVP